MNLLLGPSMENSNVPTTFATTITSGIQDISALLPLLGTEQCETHVGSALAEGYLYAAASPLSIFGILGIAKAGIKTLLATLTLPYSQVTRGAEHLRDAGFTPAGESLSLIMMDPDNRYRHLAESKLDTLLKKYHLETTEDRFKVKTPWKERDFLISLFRMFTTGTILVVTCIPLLILWLILYPLSRIISFPLMKRIRFFILQQLGLCINRIRNADWNSRLIVVTFIMSAISICPYLYFILSPNKLPYPLPLVFPVMRAFGGFLVSVCIQILIERRLTRIIQCRLAFHRLDQEVRRLIADMEKNSDQHQQTLIWDQSKSAEICLDSVQKHLEATDAPMTTSYSVRGLLRNVINTNFQSSSDAEKGKELKTLRDRVNDEMRSSWSMILWPYRILLAAGLAALVVGYVGCFTVVQNTPSTKAPLIWLGSEAALSVLRLFLWGCNPKFDDPQPIKFVLECDSSPLVPCTSTPISKDSPPGTSPTETPPIAIKAMDSVKFIETLTSHLGFMNRLNSPGFKLYFAWTRMSPKWPRPTKRALVIAFRHEKSLQDWVILSELDEGTKGKLYEAKITHGPMLPSYRDTSLPSPYLGPSLPHADATVEVVRPCPPDELMSIDPNIIALIINYRQAILDKIKDHERPYRLLGAEALSDWHGSSKAKKEALWALSAHSSSGKFTVGGKGSSEVEGKHSAHWQTIAGNSYIEQNLPVDILRTNLEHGYPGELNPDSKSGPSGYELLKTYTSILLQENVELELTALAGCRIWLDRVEDQGRQSLHSSDVIERIHHRAEFIWPKINRRRRTLEKLLESLGGYHRDHEVSQLVEWKNAMSLRLDALWQSTFETSNCAITSPRSPTAPTIEDPLDVQHLRGQLYWEIGINIPDFELKDDSIQVLREESIFHAHLARIHEQVNSLQGEHQVCFPEDSFEFASLDPWKPKNYTFIIHLRQDFKFPELKEITRALRKALKNSPGQLRSRLDFKLCPHSIWTLDVVPFGMLDDILSILKDESSDDYSESSSGI